MQTETLVYSKKQTLTASALRQVLRPLVKLMLANGLGYAFATDLLKGLFIEVAEAEFRIGGKRQTDARISLITGVHRKDVRRLRHKQPDAFEVVPANVSLGSQLIALWNADEKYLDEEGLPKPLQRFSGVGGGTYSFEDLVRSLSKDIHPRAVLDEWLRLGIARLDAQNRVCLTTDAFVPEQGTDEKLFYLGHNLHDHAEAAVSNVLGKHPAFLERCVHYDGMTAESIAELAAVSEKFGMKALREINRKANKYSEADSGQSAGNQRMTFGIYFYNAPMGPMVENKTEEQTGAA